MGTRSGNNLQAMLGSVSAYVLRHAHCPVLQYPSANQIKPTTR